MNNTSHIFTEYNRLETNPNLKLGSFKRIQRLHDHEPRPKQNLAGSIKPMAGSKLPEFRGSKRRFLSIFFVSFASILEFRFTRFSENPQTFSSTASQLLSSLNLSPKNHWILAFNSLRRYVYMALIPFIWRLLGIFVFCFFLYDLIVYISVFIG